MAILVVEADHALFFGQVVPLRPEDVRKRGLEEHITQLRADEDADAGGQPRSEVLHQAQLRGGKEVEHPRHHHSSPDRRPASLAVPVIDDQPVQRTGSARQRGSSRCQPTPSSTARRARTSVRRTGLMPNYGRVCKIKACSVVLYMISWPRTGVPSTLYYMISWQGLQDTENVRGKGCLELDAVVS